MLPASGYGIFLTMNGIELSIIIPVFNEEKNIPVLHKKIEEALPLFKNNLEIIFINDGSTDSSDKILEHLRGSSENIRVFTFNSNQGQHKAIEKGIREARGNIIVTMDGDLQNDPSDIPKLIDKLDEGFDAVCGWRASRYDPWHKVLKSRIGNYFQRKITKIELHDMSCTLRSYRKIAVKNLVLRNKYEISFVPYLLSKIGKKVTEIKVKHNPRTQDKSKYGFMPVCLGVTWYYIRLIIRDKIKFMISGKDKKDDKDKPPRL